MFVICAGLFVVSGVTALGIDATVPITSRLETCSTGRQVGDLPDGA